MSFPTNYPKEKPVWLNSWRRYFRLIMPRFATHIGRLGLQAISRTSDIDLFWGPTYYRMRLGVHTVKWEQKENDEWCISCNCGFVNSLCLHAYASAWLLQEICRRENWSVTSEGNEFTSNAAGNSLHEGSKAEQPPRTRLMGQPNLFSEMPGRVRPAGNNAGSTQGPSLVSETSFGLQAEPRHGIQPSRIAPLGRQPVRPPAATLSTDFFTPRSATVFHDTRNERPRMDSLFGEKPVMFQQISCRLVVEADFHHEPGKVGIRFFNSDTGDIRSILTIASLNNLIMELLSSGAKKRVWPAEDTEFLKWVHQYLKNIPYSMYNMTMLKLSEKEFGEWRIRWQHQPRRLIEKESQLPIPPPGNQSPCRQIVDLVREGNMVSVVLQIEFADGTRKKPYELLRTMGLDSSGGVLFRQLKEWHPPVSWAQMNKYFCRKSPGLPMDKAAGYLSELLEGHLELIQPGSLVEIRQTGEMTVTFQADVSKLGLVLSCSINGKKYPVNGPKISDDSISYHKGKFQICSIKEADVSVSKRQELVQYAAPRGEVIQGEALFKNSRVGAKQLLEFWRTIPGDIFQKKASPQVEPLLRENLTLTPELRISEHTGFVFTSLVWKTDLGVKVSNDMILQAVAHDSNLLQLDDGGWLSIDTPSAKAALERIQNHGVTEKEIMTRRDAATALSTYIKTGLVNVAEECMKRFNDIISRPLEALPVLSENLESILRPYQKTGFEFLADRILSNAGCILADDMGLGKTLQVISLLQAWKTRQKEKGKKLTVLIICPATLVGHWCNQMQQFAPELAPRAAIGTQSIRQAILNDDSVEMIVTHYGLLRYDQSLLERREYDFIILDEAQAIKNPVAQVTLAVKSLVAEHRIAMTGTPLENRLNDLWSIMDFLNKGWLGPLETFEKRYAGEALPQLAKRIGPFMLRRTKEQVALELPPKTVEVLPVEMTEKQREFYDETLAEAKVESSQGTNFEILASLTRLRQVCCDPDLLLKRESGFGSGKTEVLMVRLDELLDSGHSALVFSQFTSMLDILAKELEKRQLPFKIITGETPVFRRNRLVEEFEQNPNPEIFLLSLKAAGTGLTLTKADYVFLFDPWWNPAAERQAIDRTHRIGQTKPVFAYRLISVGTIEERVIKLLQAKQELFDAVIEESDADTASRLDRQALLQLLNG